jgi:glycerol uptake facilitator-like aquaporin
MFGREKVATLVAEFLGTFMLASAVIAALLVHAPALFVAPVAGFTLALAVLTIGAVSGAHINPAVTIGMWSIRKIDSMRAVMYVAVQLLGGAVALLFADYLLKDAPLQSIATKAFDMRIFTAEAVGALIFTFGIAAAVYQGYKGLRAAATIGTSLGIGILIASIAGGNAILNPAVAVGIHSWNFAYFTGPILGALIGMNLYVQLFVPRAPRRVASKVTVAKSKSAAKKRR